MVNSSHFFKNFDTRHDLPVCFIYDVVFSPGLIWHDLIWFYWIWQDLTEFYMIWQDLTELERIWLDLIGFDRIWQDLIDFDKIWQDLTWFDKIWKDSTNLIEINRNWKKTWKVQQLRQYRRNRKTTKKCDL